MSFSRVGDGVPLNAKGQILTHTGTSLATLPVGTDGQILISQSSASSGLTWQNVPSGETEYISLIAQATLTQGAQSITFSNIPGTYDDLLLILNEQRYNNTGISQATLRINSNSTTVYRYQFWEYAQTGGTSSSANIYLIFYIDGVVPAPFEFYFSGYATSNAPKPVLMKGGFNSESLATSAAPGQVLHGMWNSSDAITSITLYPGTPTQTTRTWDASTPHFAILYGIKRS
jgi:hypothetical protein